MNRRQLRERLRIMFARILLQLYELSTQNDVRVHYQIDKANGQGHNPRTFLKGFIVVVFLY